MKNATLIYNPNSRRIRGDLREVNIAYHRLFQKGIDARPLATKGPGHATELARHAIQATELIIAFGGDGTINEVVCGMAQTKVPLGILPGGTANVFAEELGMPWDLTQCIDIIAQGKLLEINLGYGGGRYFHSMAGIGIDASIVKRVSPRLKRIFGRGAFWLEGFKHFFHDLPSFSITVDGCHYSSTFAVISNARYYGGRFLIAPLAHLSEEVLDVCIFTTAYKLRYVMYLPLAYFGIHRRLSGIVYLKARNVSAESETPVYVQMDGELAGRLPMEFRTVPNGLLVIVPRNRVQGPGSGVQQPE